MSRSLNLYFMMCLVVSGYSQIPDSMLCYPCHVPEAVTLKASELTADLNTDSTKALAILEWVASGIDYDHSAIKGKRLNRHSGDVLAAGKAICFGFAQLVRDMCMSVGIRSYIVSGYSDPFGNVAPETEVNHAWNAVKIRDRWILVDATWAASHFKKGREDHLIYFDPDPELFRKTHLPLQPRWQLIDCPISRTSDSVVYCGNRDTINSYSRMTLEQQKVRDVEIAFENFPTRENLEEYMQTLTDIAILYKELGDDSEVTEEAAQKYDRALNLFEKAALTGVTFFDWQYQAYAFTLLNAARLKYNRLGNARETRKEIDALIGMYTRASELLRSAGTGFQIQQAMDLCARQIDLLQSM